MGKRGLVFAGGGIKAACHIGAIKALEEEKIEFDYVAGTSSGSIIALLYSMGYSSNQMYKIFKKYCKKIKHVEGKNIVKIILGLVFEGKIIVDGLNSGKVIERAVKEVCKEKNINNINQIKKKLIIPAVNLQNGELVVFSSKQLRKTYVDTVKYITDASIEKAVRASCSYPSIISPCKYKEMQLIDGGIRENVAWRELKKIGAEKVLGIVFENIIEDENYFENMIEIAVRSLDIMGHELANYELYGIDELVKIQLKKVSLLDYTRFDELYKLGYKIMKEKLHKRDIFLKK